MSSIQITNLTFSYDGSYDTILTPSRCGSILIGRSVLRGETAAAKRPFSSSCWENMNTRDRSHTKAAFVLPIFPFPWRIPRKAPKAAVAAVSPDSALWQLKRECALLSLDEAVLKRPFGTLSPGEQTKLMLAALFLDDRRYLLIDEPTNHLDARARAIVSAYLNTKKGFLLVSHDRCFLDQCVDHILSIHKTKIEIQKGNFSSWWCNQERQTQLSKLKMKSWKGTLHGCQALQNGPRAGQTGWKKRNMTVKIPG